MYNVYQHVTGGSLTLAQLCTTAKLKFTTEIRVHVAPAAIQYYLCIIAKPKGEASNRGARVAVSLYMYVYI